MPCCAHSIIRRESWSEWDPYFLGYGRSALSRASDAARAAGAWCHAWQLREPAGVLPAVLQPLCGIPAQSATLALVALVLGEAATGRIAAAVAEQVCSPWSC